MSLRAVRESCLGICLAIAVLCLIQAAPAQEPMLAKGGRAEAVIVVGREAQQAAVGLLRGDDEL